VISPLASVEEEVISLSIFESIDDDKNLSNLDELKCWKMIKIITSSSKIFVFHSKYIWIQDTKT
jgi:hypothetical protein